MTATFLSPAIAVDLHVGVSDRLVGKGNGIGIETVTETETEIETETGTGTAIAIATGTENLEVTGMTGMFLVLEEIGTAKEIGQTIETETETETGIGIVLIVTESESESETVTEIAKEKGREIGIDEIEIGIGIGIGAIVGAEVGDRPECIEYLYTTCMCTIYEYQLALGTLQCMLSKYMSTN